ncbi:maltose/maltodextrin ABC transporter substrate-binding protein MalE [Verrucomicrobiaceae bacterium N1E253]|uniref:Maltose/maltodextrin ABC transporter substrate-binding protein MalE n=1 Tax=Oceaniferula marina TaxID=2748318 RepID=A0A851GFU5_9BACT|nr:maltose/maltodextrin ABC transporter substrate-binding protein MalE [Oceaniferula marina]NWK56383.1 maltose/maltodextrin ABC transporter substrate-binding protein MalE [Oceaniferula marina]
MFSNSKSPSLTSSPCTKPICTLACLALIATTGYSFAGKEGELLVWIGGDKGYRGLAEIGKRFERELGRPVKVEAPEGVTDKFQQAAQSGKGPDIIFWAHDRAGEWASAGLLSPVRPKETFKAKFEAKGWDGFKHGGKIWGYPVALEAVGLIYNKDLVKSPPAQLSEIKALNARLQREHQASAILWDYQNTFFSWGIMASDGGYVFGNSKNGEYDVADIGIANRGSIDGLNAIVQLIDDGVMPKGASYSVMEARMNSSEVAMMISGPWAWANLRKSGINFGVAPVPGINGKPGRPFVGVLGAMINRSSPNKELAREFIEHYVLTDEGLKTIDRDVPLGVPARTTTYQDLAAENPLIAATMQNVTNGVLMPNVPEMGKFWSASTTALQIATNGQATPDKALKDAAENMK